MGLFVYLKVYQLTYLYNSEICIAILFIFWKISYIIALNSVTVCRIELCNIIESKKISNDQEPAHEIMALSVLRKLILQWG